MNNPDFHKDRSSLQLLGKEFMIVVVVIFSALSFTLGYFVGKSGVDTKSVNPSQAAEMVPVPQKQETVALPQPQNTIVAENKTTPQSEVTAKEPVQAQKEPLVIADRTAKEKTAAQPVTQLPKEPAKDTGKKSEAKNSAASEDSGKLDEPTYTVQMAAFKSAS